MGRKPRNARVEKKDVSEQRRRVRRFIDDEAGTGDVPTTEDEQSPSEHHSDQQFLDETLRLREDDEACAHNALDNERNEVDEIPRFDSHV